MSPEIVDGVKDEATGNAMDTAIYGIATGFGKGVFGPLGQMGGSLLAGAYTGGSMGNTMTVIGAGNGLSNLIASGMNTSGGSTSGTKEL